MFIHDYYTLDEASKKLKCEVADLTRWAATGKIRLSIFVDRKGIHTGMDYLLQKHAVELEHYGMTNINFTHYKDNGDVLFHEKEQITIDVVLITADELEKAKGFIQPKEPCFDHPTGKVEVTITEKPVLTPKDKAEKDKLFRERYYTFLTISDFIDTVLSALLGEDEKIKTFCSLVAHGLKVYDKGIEGKPVNRDELINHIKQAESDFWKQDDLNIDFWRGLENERKYKVLIEEVELAYFFRCEDEFPWVDFEGNPVMLPVRVNDQSPELNAELNTAYEASHKAILANFKQWLETDMPNGTNSDSIRITIKDRLKKYSERVSHFKTSQRYHDAVYDLLGFLERPEFELAINSKSEDAGLIYEAVRMEFERIIDEVANPQQADKQPQKQDEPVTNETESQGYNLPGNNLEANSDEYERALLMDWWSDREALCWLHKISYRYYRGDHEKDFREECQLIERARVAGKLPKDEKGATPLQWIEWAKTKWDVPWQLEKFAIDQARLAHATAQVLAQEANKETSKIQDPRHLHPKEFGSLGIRMVGNPL